jgi:hypothetical protein
MRGAGPDEHRAAFRGLGTAPTQIVSYRFADIDRQRQPLDPIALADYSEFTSTPIDVV